MRKGHRDGGQLAGEIGGKMKEFILHWKDGKDEKVKGTNIADAMTKAGYGKGALPALDYWEEVEKKKTKDNYAP